MSTTRSDRYTEALAVSWDRLHRDARELARRLAARGAWRRVVAITRGGLVPACIVARELDIRRVEALGIVSYDHMSQGALSVLGPVTPGEPPELDLVVDDLVDTGRTAAAVRELLPAAHLAAVYAKPEGRPLVDTFVAEVSQDTWIHLPWDLELRFAPPLVQAPGRPAAGAGPR